jgi:hypothetical protein
MFGKESRDQKSGFGTACRFKHFTELIVIDESTGRALSEKSFDNFKIKNFVVASDGRLLASADVWDNCLANPDAAVMEISTDISIKTLFRYGGPLEKLVGELTILPDGRLVLVGQIKVLFDLNPYVKRDPSDISWLGRAFTGELLLNDRHTINAFVVLLDREGNFVADRVIRDLRGRVLRAAAAQRDGSIVFGGLANGVSSWLGVIDAK